MKKMRFIYLLVGAGEERALLLSTDQWKTTTTMMRPICQDDTCRRVGQGRSGSHPNMQTFEYTAWDPELCTWAYVPNNHWVCRTINHIVGKYSMDHPHQSTTGFLVRKAQCVP